MASAFGISQRRPQPLRRRVLVLQRGSVGPERICQSVYSRKTERAICRKPRPIRRLNFTAGNRALRAYVVWS